jgi:RNA polymerase sigma factor (sigma-70 family)
MKVLIAGKPVNPLKERRNPLDCSIAMDRKPSAITTDLQKWHQGKREGLEALLDRHLAWIKARVRDRLGDGLRRKVDSGDIVQDAILKFLQHGPRFTVSDEDHFRALIARIVENVLRDKHDWFTAKRRSIALERPLPPETVLCIEPGKGDVRTPSQSAQIHEEEAWIRLGMEILEPRHREMLVFHLWEHLSFSEIGNRIDLAPDAAWKRYNRAIIRLSETVGDLRRGILPVIEEEDLDQEKSDDPSK